jgi:hypothetical protein
MNVVFVARQSDKAPLADDNEDNASTREWGFFITSRWLDEDFEGGGEN